MKTFPDSPEEENCAVLCVVLCCVVTVEKVLINAGDINYLPGIISERKIY